MIMTIQDEIRRTRESRYDHRLHAVLLVAQGMSSREVGQILGDSPRTVAYWVKRFETDGVAGLVDGERSGRPSRLTRGQLSELESALRKDPVEWGLHGPWDGKTLSVFIQRKWNVALGVRQCQRLFRQLGQRRKPRLKLASANPVRQTEYLKAAENFGD
jgi:transposase